nr:hypothetical protein B0A51_02898 [Rachicladosporium sp. CCFEE 5018]OQO29872.1 hypothetical protein B0A51_02324 [Rachicladosporium sp. CCFEE 5018]
MAVPYWLKSSTTQNRRIANIVERFLLNSITHKRALLAHPTLFVRAPLVHANNGNFTLHATERAVATLRYNAREYLHHATRSPTLLIDDLRVRVTTSSAVVETSIAECELLTNSFRSGKGTHFATVTELDWGNGRPLAALTQEHDTLRETLDELAGQVRAARRVLRVDRQYLSTTNPLRNDERTNTLQEYLELDTLFRDRPDDTLATNADDEEGGVSIES